MENHNSKRNEDLISEYEAQHKEYETFTTKLVSDIRKFLETGRIDCLINGRTKTVSSLSNKFAHKGQKYDSLFDIPDLTGVRIVVDRDDEIKRVRKIINKKFRVEEEPKEEDRISDIDKTKGCPGYQRHHTIISMDGKKAEIQIRTLLQHSWAKFSHKYCYKNEDKVNDYWRHNLFVLSDVLHRADKEFTWLFEKYPLIKEEALDKFLHSTESPLPQLKGCAEAAGFKVLSRGDEPLELSALIWACQKIGIETEEKLQEDLQRALDKHGDEYLAELHDKIGVSWTVELAFLVELMLYKVCPTHFTVTDLIEQHWSKHLAEKVHKIAEKYHHKDHCDEHH